MSSITPHPLVIRINVQMRLETRTTEDLNILLEAVTEELAKRKGEPK